MDFQIQDQNKVLKTKEEKLIESNFLPKDISSFHSLFLSCKKDEDSISSKENSSKKFLEHLPNQISEIEKIKNTFSIDNKSLINSFKNERKKCLIYEPNNIMNKHIQCIKNENSFFIVSDDIVTTFFLSEFKFSEFSNPLRIEKNNRSKENQNFSFLIRKAKSCFNIKKITDKKVSSLKKINEFISSLNNLIIDDNFIQILKHFKFKLFILWITLIFCIFCFTGFIILGIYYYIDQSKQNPFSYLVLIISLCFVSIFSFKLIIQSMREIPIKLQKEVLIYRINNSKKIEEFIFSWNKTYFNQNSINIYLPISANYILFNLNSNFEVLIIDQQKEYFDKN